MTTFFLNYFSKSKTVHLTLCTLCNISCFFCHLLFFSKFTLSKNNCRNTIKVSNSVGPDLDPNCLQKLSADRVKYKWIVKSAQNFTLSGAVVLVYTVLSFIF